MSMSNTAKVSWVWIVVVAMVVVIGMMVIIPIMKETEAKMTSVTAALTESGITLALSQYDQGRITLIQAREFKPGPSDLVQWCETHTPVGNMKEVCK